MGLCCSRTEQVILEAAGAVRGGLRSHLGWFGERVIRCRVRTDAPSQPRVLQAALSGCPSQQVGRPLTQGFM